MTQEERELLLQDLCSRLPYGVIIEIDYLANDDWHSQYPLNPECDTLKVVDLNTGIVITNGYSEYNIEEVKPYLRPMESMTENEKEELWKAIDKDTDILMSNLDAPIISTYKGRVYRGELIHYEHEFLNKHHFDYRGLIPIGLAIAAPEGMYN